MLKIFTTETFDKLFLKLEEKIQVKAAKRTEIFKTNPFNPILNTEKLYPKKYNLWSFRVDLHYRIVFRFLENNVVELMYVGHHNQIYNYDIFR